MSAREPKSSPARRKTTGAETSCDGWDCPSCTFKNARTVYKCQVCGSGKGTSTRRGQPNIAIKAQQEVEEDLKKRQKAKMARSVSMSGSIPSPATSGVTTEPSNESSPTVASPTPVVSISVKKPGVKTEDKPKRKRKKSSPISPSDVRDLDAIQSLPVPQPLENLVGQQTAPKPKKKTRHVVTTDILAPPNGSRIFTIVHNGESADFHEIRIWEDRESSAESSDGSGIGPGMP